MNISNPQRNTNIDLSKIRELTLEETDQISGGEMNTEFTHGRGCACRTCRTRDEIIGDE